MTFFPHRFGFKSNKARNRSPRNSSNALQYSRLEPRQLLAIDVSGVIDVDTVWDDPQGYRFVDEVYVSSGVTLSISPGIEVTGSSPNAFLQVLGTVTTDDVSFDARLLASVSTATVNFSNSNFTGRDFHLTEDASGSISDNVFTGVESLILDDSELSFGSTTFQNNSIQDVVWFQTSPSFGDQLVNNTFSADSPVEVFGSSHGNSGFWPIENVNYSYASLRVEADTLLTFHPGTSFHHRGNATVLGTLRLDNAMIYGRSLGTSDSIYVDGGVYADGGALLEVLNNSLIQQDDDPQHRRLIRVTRGGQATIADSSTYNLEFDIRQRGHLNLLRSQLDEKPSPYANVGHFEVRFEGSVNVVDSHVAQWLSYIGYEDSSSSNFMYSTFDVLYVNGFPNYSFHNNVVERAFYLSSGDSSRTINLENNYWGTTDADEIAVKINDQNDDSDLPLVDFTPFLNSSPFLHGTAGDDVVSVVVGADTYVVTYNGVATERNNTEHLRLMGFGGNDSVNVQLYDTDDVVEETDNSLTIWNTDLLLEFFNFEDVVIDSGGGDDIGTFQTPEIDGFFRLQDGAATIGGANENTVATGFEELNVHATEEGVRAALWGTEDDDSFVLGRGTARLTSDGLTTNIFDFSKVKVLGNGGFDTSILLDSERNDSFFSREDEAYLSNDLGTFASVFDFDRVSVRSEFGSDTAFIEGTTGNDTFFANPTTSQLLTGDKLVAVVDFDEVTSRSGQGGDDKARLSGTEAKETFVGAQTFSSLTDGNTTINAVRYNDVTARGNGGDDVAHLSDSSGDDTLYVTPELAVLRNDLVSLTATGFAHVYTNASTGNDVATFRDSGGDDTFVGRPGSGLMSGAGYENFALGFDRYSATATSGLDIARFFDSTGNENLYSLAENSALIGSNFRLDASGFKRVIVVSVGGNDNAYLTDTEGDDTLGARAFELWMLAPDYFRFIAGFEVVQAGAVNGGVNRLNVGAVDFDLTTYGDWI